MNVSCVKAMAAVLLVTLSACFSYVPAAPSGPPQGARVRAHLEAPADYRVGRFTLHDILLVDGEIARWGDDRVVLSAWNLRSGTGQSYDVEGQTVEIPLTNLQQLETRRISATKSILLGGAVTALAILVPTLLRGGGGGGNQGGTSNPR